MEISEINTLKRNLYTVVLKTIRENTEELQAREMIQEQLERQRIEHVADPTRGLMVDLFA